jgi:hypothetical protein
MKMDISLRNFLVPSLMLIASTLHAAPVALSSQFDGGIFGAFNLSYTSGVAGLKLQQVTIALQSPLFLDPTIASPGSLLPLPFIGGSGAASTGFTGVTGVFDGATSFTLSFDDFDAGESFSFNLDVDSPCNNLFCQIDGSFTSGAEFAGSKLTAVFGGSGYNSGQFEGLYTRQNTLSAVASITGDVEPVPEPGTYALLGGGLLMFVVARRRISTSAGDARDKA